MKATYTEATQLGGHATSIMIQIEADSSEIQANKALADFIKIISNKPAESSEYFPPIIEEEKKEEEA